MLKHILILSLLLILAAGLNGCSKKTEPAAPQQEVQAVQETTQQAQKEVTKENLDEELSKMEKEIDADISTEQ